MFMILCPKGLGVCNEWAGGYIVSMCCQRPQEQIGDCKISKLNTAPCFSLKSLGFYLRKGEAVVLSWQVMEHCLSSGVGLERREDKVEISDPVKSHGSRR